MFTAKDVMALREMSGAGMMDCKKALTACEGDMDKAMDYLREKSLAASAKKAARIAAEGIVSSYVTDDHKVGAIVEVNCETDFVSSSDKFHDLVAQVTDVLLKNCPATLEEATELTKDLFADATIAMGEKFVLRRYEILSAAEGQAFGAYSHMQGKISGLVLLSKDGGDLNLSLIHISEPTRPY